MDMVKNFLARAKAIWAAAKQTTEEEHARNDTRLPENTRYLPSDESRSIRSEAVRSVYPFEIEPSPQLLQFRLLVGIHQDKSFRAPQGFNPAARPIVSTGARPAPNLGLYATVFDKEIKSKRAYKFASRLINSCLGLQIVVAAALTALGAANGSHGAVTVFGAINTIIAGFLTYLKGSGLPSRLKYYQYEWGRVREYIEQRERDLSLPNCPDIDVYAEIEIIRKMYEAVRTDIEQNTPDRFVGVGSVRNQPAQNQPPILMRPQVEYHNGMGSLRGAADGRIRQIGDMEKDVEAYGRDYLHGQHSDLERGTEDGKVWLQGREAQVGSMMKGAEAFGKAWLHDRQAQANDTMAGAQHNLERNGRNILNQAQTGLDRAAADTKEWLNDRETKANTFTNRTAHFGSDLFSGVKGLKDRLEDKMKEIGELEKAVEHHGRQVVEEKTLEVRELEKTVEDHGRQVAEEKSREMGSFEKEIEHEVQAKAEEAAHLGDDIERVAAEKQQEVARQAALKSEQVAQLGEDAEALTKNA